MEKKLSIEDQIKIIQKVLNDPRLIVDDSRGNNMSRKCKEKDEDEELDIEIPV